MELIAAEPLVMDPVAMAYDEDGRAWVVEMSDYPYTDKTKDVPFQEKTADLPLGRVRILEDVDGDGKFDKSYLFADQLSWPTGIALYQGRLCRRHARHLVLQRHQRRPPRGRASQGVHRVSQVQCSSGHQQPGLGVGQRDLRRRLEQRRPDHVARCRRPADHAFAG